VKTTAESAGTPAGRAAGGARPVGVLVVDDSLVFRTGMARAVSACEGLQLLGEADGGEAALEAIARLAPEVVILDWQMPDLDAIGVLKRVCEQNPRPKCRVIVISAVLDHEVERRLLDAGADRCLSKAISRAEICSAAHELAAA